MGTSVSVIIPTHERSALLGRAIDSVLAQTYDDVSCLVVDDGSTDDTPAVVDGYDDDRVRYFRHETSRGASAARNTGIEAATGDYVAFLDDDDEWYPQKLAKQVPMLAESEPETALVYCWLQYVDEADGPTELYRPTLSGDIFPEMLDGQRIGNSSTLLVRREVAEAVGGFDESLPRGNDGDFIRRLCRDHRVTYVPEVLVNAYVNHGHRRISNDDERGLRNSVRAHEAKLEKFEAELMDYPVRAANIEAEIAHHYGRLGEWGASIEHYRRAITTAPHSPRVYRRLIGSVRDAVSRA